MEANTGQTPTKLGIIDIERTHALVRNLAGQRGRSRTKVAEELEITTGQLTASVKAVESNWGVRLVVPGTRRLTAAGREFADTGDIFLRGYATFRNIVTFTHHNG